MYEKRETIPQNNRLFFLNAPHPLPALLARRSRQAEALRKELTMVKDKAKAYITKLNDVSQVSGAVLSRTLYSPNAQTHCACSRRGFHVRSRVGH